jgi:hypothetical protein
MQRYRYTGPDESRDLALSGGVITFPRMKWVDPARAADEAGIDNADAHLEIALRGLGPDFEPEGPKKAARTRKARTKAEQPDEPPAPAPADQPVDDRDEEQQS